MRWREGAQSEWAGYLCHTCYNLSMARPKRLALLGKKGDAHPRFKSGRILRPDGYVRVLSGNHPWPRKYHYIFEHVMVIESHLGRRMAQGETIHHKNGDRADNRLANLILMNRGRHMSQHAKTRTLNRDALGRFHA